MLKKLRTFNQLYIILLISINWQSCTSNIHKVDTDDIDVDIKVTQYEDWIFSIKDQNDYEQLYKNRTHQ